MKREECSEELCSDSLAAEIKADFLERQACRRPYELVWRLNMNFLIGNQYCAVNGKGEIEQEEKYYFWQERQVFNHIAPIVETRISRLSKVRPRPIIRPYSSSDADIGSAKLATAILDGVRENVKLSETVAEATVWSETCGTSFYKVVWDDAVGDAAVTACSPFEIYPDSNVNQSIEECDSIIHAKVFTVKEVKRIWGAEVSGEKERVFILGTSGGNGGLFCNSAVPTLTQQLKEDRVLVMERYTRGDECFPDGKLEIAAGGKMLYSGPLPYVLGQNGQRILPFIMQTSYQQPGCFWGSSVVERTIPVQRAYNAVKNRKHEFLNRLSMGILTVEDGSVDTDSLEEEGLSPGKILVYRQGAAKPEILNGGDVPSEFEKEEQRLISEFVEVSGVSEFSRSGITPESVNSGVALQLIADQDDMRMSSTVESIKSGIKKISYFVLKLYKQFAERKKLLKITDGEGRIEAKYFALSELSSDDIVFETENESSASIAARKTMLMELIAAGVLSDKEGKLNENTKTKILALMGFSGWENSEETSALHRKRAAEENLGIIDAKTLSVDDHGVHIDEHTRYVISGKVDVSARDRLITHIAEHISAKEKQNDGKQV